MGGQRSLKVRDDRIDSVKFWLIVLVIAAHVLMRKEFDDSRACVAVWNWINIFAMPLFIFISGYFSRRKEKKDFLPSIWKLLEPLIIFQIVGLLFYVDKSISIKTILTPWHMLWYLLSLMYWRLMLQFIPDKILRHKKIIFTCTVCISILAGFIPVGRVLSIQRTLAYLPFFFLGYYMRGRNLYISDKYKPYSIVISFVILAILFFFPHRIRSLFQAAPYANIYGVAIRMISLSVAVPMSIAFLNVCYNTPWFARQGRKSMQYYIYHPLIIPPLMVAIGMLNVPMNIITAIVITIGIIMGIYFALKIPYVKMLTNPSLIFVKQK